MKRATNRHRRTIPARAAAPLTALLASLAILAVPAQAEGPGGATTIAASKAKKGAGLAFTPLRWAGATWYGPGLYGNRTACGQVLRPRTMGVAHRRLPCGTVVKFVHRGRRIVTRVIDRGPFTRGNAWDLTNGARSALRFSGTGKVRYAIALQYAKRGASARTASR